MKHGGVLSCCAAAKHYLGGKRMENCNLCASDRTVAALTAFDTHGRHVLGEGGTFVYHRCTDCGNIFLTGVPVDQDYYRKYYAPGYFGSPGSSPSDGALTEFINRIVACSRNHLIRRYASRAGARIALLDVGCGSGAFLGLLDDRIYERTGVELNPQGVALSRARGLTVFEGDIRTTKLPEGSFDVITLWHVLEHVHDPVTFLKQLKVLKKPGGVAVIAVPNSDSLGFRLGREWWFHLDAPRHLFLPNRASMNRLFSSVGFDVLDVTSPVFEYPLDLFWSVRRAGALAWVYPLYPLAKLISRETLIFVVR